MSAKQTEKIQRPLSPHLTIYKPQITSVLSISHRITGFLLTAGAVVFVSWLWSAAYSSSCFANMKAFASSFLGRGLLFIWTLCLYYHLANGIRHLFWDAGYGFEVTTAYRSGYAVLLATVLLTAVTWYLAFI